MPVVGGGEEAAAPEPSTIYAAGKLSGRLASGVTAGLVSAVTGRNDVAVESPTGASQDVLAEPLALANVARIKVAVGSGTNLGVLATSLQRFEPENAYPTMMQPSGEETQQCPDGSSVAVGARCFHDSYVAGHDASWRSASGTYVAAGQVLATSIQDGPSRTMLDGTVIKSGDTSPAGRLYLAKEGGQWLASLEAQAVGRRVDYNDLGYLQRQNLVPLRSLSGVSNARSVLGDRRDGDPRLHGDPRQPRWGEAAPRVFRGRQGPVRELVD